MLQKPFFVNIFIIKRMDFYEVNGDVIDSILAFCIFYLTKLSPEFNSQKDLAQLLVSCTSFSTRPIKDCADVYIH